MKNVDLAKILGIKYFSYKAGDMARKSLPGNRKFSDYEGVHTVRQDERAKA